MNNLHILAISAALLFPMTAHAFNLQASLNQAPINVGIAPQSAPDYVKMETFNEVAFNEKATYASVEDLMGAVAESDGVCDETCRHIDAVLTAAINRAVETRQAMDIHDPATCTFLAQNGVECHRK